MEQCRREGLIFCNTDILNPLGPIYYFSIKSQKEFLIIHDAMHLVFGFGIDSCGEYKIEEIHRCTGIFDFDSLSAIIPVKEFLIYDKPLDIIGLVPELERYSEIRSFFCGP
jgi:hypothetical protein